MSFKTLMPVRFFFAFAILLVGIVIFAMLWFMFFSGSGVFYMISAVSRNITYQMGANSTQYDMTDAFFTQLSSWLLILAFIGLIFAVVAYTQRKKALEALGLG